MSMILSEEPMEDSKDEQNDAIWTKKRLNMLLKQKGLAPTPENVKKLLNARVQIVPPERKQNPDGKSKV